MLKQFRSKGMMVVIVVIKATFVFIVPEVRSVNKFERIWRMDLVLVECKSRSVGLDGL